jgi:hypothetical protein
MLVLASRITASRYYSSKDFHVDHQKKWEQTKPRQEYSFECRIFSPINSSSESHRLPLFAETTSQCAGIQCKIYTDE